ncbi:MAG TPA: methyltransferase domain-containing protein, partial [Phycisphaerae bacterium]|nr:methyltransferase domain-containing protein [Phycisphaerae bacterium]
MLARHASTLPPFDVVFLGDVIEHVPDPRDLLKDVYRVLAPRGSVCIDTPNWGGFWRRIGRSRWLGINPFHINLFDATALTHLLERCGFRRIETHAYTHYQYASLNSRPEFARLLSWLPRFMRSRIRSILTAAAGAGDWADLRDHSPATLEQASDFIHRAARDLPALRMSRWGDNLMATALRA